MPAFTTKSLVKVFNDGTIDELDPEVLRKWVVAEMSPKQFEKYEEILADVTTPWVTDADVVKAFGRFVSENNGSWALFQAMLRQLSPEISDAQLGLVDRLLYAFDNSDVDLHPQIIDAIALADGKRDMSRAIDKGLRFARMHKVHVPTYDEYEAAMEGTDKPFSDQDGAGDQYT